MNKHQEPLVSVLTPVYNGASYLAECIESVLSQLYSNWEYIIVNNHSSDSTLEIAQRYAKLEPRIHVHSNELLLDVITNHNRAFRLASPSSKYCKIVSADDWLLPECLARMVALAEANPSVGIVGSYQLSGGGPDWRDWSVKWGQIPYPSPVVSGREVGRLHMLGGLDVFGSPTSLLYRADLVREHDRFYPNATAEADTSACCRCLQHADYGFVHQVLCYERVHDVRVTTRSQSLNVYLSSDISDLLTYGNSFLTPNERNQRLRQMMTDYYRFLAVSALKLREKSFWAYHKERLKALGYPLNRLNLSRTMAATLLGLVLNPIRAIELLARTRQRA